MTPARARTRRRLAGIAASLVVHGALLLAFMSVAPRLVTVPRLPAPPERVFEVQLQRLSVSRSAASAAAPHMPRTAASALPAFPRLIPRSDLPAPTAPTRSAAAPRSAAASGDAPAAAQAIGAAGAGDGHWRVRGEGGDAGAAARALARGTIGCGAAEYLHLTADERDHCNAEFVRGMRTLKPDAIPAAKRAYYDQVAASYVKMHAPMPFSEANLADNLGVQERWHAPEGAKMPSLGCGLRLGRPPRDWKTYADKAKPPHSLKLGPLPCYVTPPSGYGTEEADVPTPASLREQQDDAAQTAKYAPQKR